MRICLFNFYIIYGWRTFEGGGEEVHDPCSRAGSEGGEDRRRV